MTSLTEQKYHLFQLISNINNPGVLKWLEKELLKKQAEFSTDTNGHKPKPAQLELHKKFQRPIRKKLDPKFLKKAQGWSGHNETALLSAIHELAIEEPIEELLAQLSS